MVRRGCSTAANSEYHFPVTSCRVFHYSFPPVALLSTTGKCQVSRTLHYVSISLLLTSHFNAFLAVCQQPSSKIKYLIINYRSKITVSLSFVQKI